MSTKPDKLQPLPAHPYATLFPAMSDEEFKKLVADIKANGQTTAITTIEDEDGNVSILDGVNRQKACLSLGIEPKRTPYQGNDPLSFVVSANLHRRHLDKSRHAALGAEIANMKPGRRGKHAMLQVSRKAAAAAVNASERSIADASKVKEQGDPALFDAVRDGTIPVNVAANLTHAPKDEQREAIQNVKRDAEGKPTPAAKKALKATAVRARAEAKKTKPKLMGKPKVNGAKAALPNFKEAVNCFASAVDHLFNAKWNAIIEDERLPPKERDRMIGFLLRLMGKAKTLRDKLEGKK